MSQLSRRSVLSAGSGLTIAGVIGLLRPAMAQSQGMMVAADGYSFMSSEPRLTTWVQLISAGGLEQYARGATPYTTMPATDAAFAEFPNLARSLLGYQQTTGTHNSQDAFPDTSKIVKLVRSHVISGKHYANEIMGKKVTVTTVAGTTADIDASNPSSVTVSWTSSANGKSLVAHLVDAPVTCINCVVYMVDKIEEM